MTPAEVEKPIFVFQDVVTKIKFVSCDISGDGEYIVGGAQGNDTKYELYIWNTTTGALMDKLTGSNVQLYSVAWHPTRSFLAVAAADGLVDVWGPRINWTGTYLFICFSVGVREIDVKSTLVDDVSLTFFSHSSHKKISIPNCLLVYTFCKICSLRSGLSSPS